MLLYFSIDIVVFCYEKTAFIYKINSRSDNETKRGVEFHYPIQNMPNLRQKDFTRLFRLFYYSMKLIKI